MEENGKWVPAVRWDNRPAVADANGRSPITCPPPPWGYCYGYGAIAVNLHKKLAKTLCILPIYKSNRVC